MLDTNIAKPAMSRSGMDAAVHSLTTAYHSAASPQNFLSAWAHILFIEQTSFVSQLTVPYECVIVLQSGIMVVICTALQV